MSPPVDLPAALSVLTSILTAQFNVINDESPTDPSPPILQLVAAAIFAFQSIYRVHLRVLITVPHFNLNSNFEPQIDPPQPQYGIKLIKWECPALARNSSFSAVEVDEFMKTIEKVDVSSLKQDERECDICREDFSHPPGSGSSTNPAPASDAQESPEQFVSDEELETPVRLACGHVYGENCLKLWISRKKLEIRRPVLCAGLILRAEASR